MADFGPIDMAIANPAPRYFRDPEPKRFPRELLQLLASHDGSHRYPYCWGFAIFRTVYTPGSDDASARAVARLADYARAFAHGDLVRRPKPNEEAPDPLPNQELWRRYFSEVVEDRDALDGADVQEVGRRFDAWVAGELEERPGRRDVPNSRFRICIMLDAQGVDDVLAMPEDPRDWGRRGEEERWVKVVTNEMWDERGFPGRGRLWLRADVRQAVWSTWFGLEDPDFVYEYVGWSEDEADGALNFWGSPPGVDV